MGEGSWVGLDVHARSVVAGVLDAGSGELRTLRLPAGYEQTVAWLGQLPAPVRVAYEAGPTGYGLARACAGVGITCTVAAPSRITRAAADKVKTDRRDAERLARLLRLGELVAVRVPEPHEEAARDLVRAREDARGDLMRARHGSEAASASRDRLRRDRVDGRSRPVAARPDVLQPAFRARVRRLLRRDAADQDASRRARPGDRGARHGTAVRRDRRTALSVSVGSRRRQSASLDSRLSSATGTRFKPESLGPFLGLTPSEDSSGREASPGRDHEDRKQPCPPPACRGGLAPAAPAASERHAREAPRHRQPAAVRARADRSARRLNPTLASTREPRQTTHDRRGRRRPRARRPLLGARHDGVATTPQRLRRGERNGETDARRRPAAETTSSPNGATPDLRERHHLFTSHTRSCGPDPRISVATDTSTTAAALPPPKNEGPQRAGLPAVST